MAPGLVGHDHEALLRCRSLDWPLSREEKKGRVMQLYEDEVRAVELLLVSQEQALEALEADVAARDAAGQERIDSPTTLKADVVARDAAGQDGKAISSRGFRQRRHSAKHTVKRSSAWADAPVGTKSRWTPRVTVSSSGGSLAPRAWQDSDTGRGLPNAISCLGSAPPAPGDTAEIQDYGVSRSSKLPAATSCCSLHSEPPLRYGDLRQLICYGGGGKDVMANAQKSSGLETQVDMKPDAVAAAVEAEAPSAMASGETSGEVRWWPAGETGGLVTGVQQCKGGADAGGLGQQFRRVSFSSEVEVPQGLASDQGDCRMNHERFPQITWKPSLARTWTPRALPSPCRSQQPFGRGQ